MQIINSSSTWKEVELQELVECLDNKRVPLNDEQRKKIPGDIPYYGANGQVDSIDSFIFNEKLLLIAEDGGSWGRGNICSYIIDGKSWVNNHAHVLRVKKELADIKFLMYWINYSDLSRYISGTTRGKLNQNSMNKIKISLPHLEIQKKIVSVLEKAEELKQKREMADKLTQEYLKSVFHEMFLKNKFPEIELGEITKIVSGATPSTAKLEYWDGEINWVTPAELLDGSNYYYYETQRKITETGLKSCSAEIFPKNTVMLTTRAPIGKVALAGREMCSNQGFKNFICEKNKLNPIYLYFWFLTNKTYLQSLGRGATFGEISKSGVSKIKIPIPSIELQNKFATIVEYVEEMKEKQLKNKEYIGEMFNSLMQKAFNGELIQ